nr:MAG TPA: hypothetical protein [Caudoviricetes sp.]
MNLIISFGHNGLAWLIGLYFIVVGCSAAV